MSSELLRLIFATEHPTSDVETYLAVAESLFDEGECEGVAHGNSRVAVIYPRYVIKLPLTEAGRRANRAEAAMSDAVDGIPMAQCRLMEMRGVEVLWMEYVEPVVASDELPPWALGVDEVQVGYTAEGLLVAYDL